MRFLGNLFKKLLFWLVLGFIFLGIFNFIGGKFGLSLAINPATLLIAGVLDIPGIILLAALRYLVFNI